ncbi:MAG TPA: hypothetical protein VLX92_28035, partial [Kofleriaceae bacterium]|nr:hypothetical protein [Kofleriaceae bacterium]
LVVALAAASAADRPSRWRWLAVAAAVAVLGGVGGYVAVMAHEAVAGARPRPRNQASATLGARTRAVLNRALHDDPAARFPSIGELVVALAAASAADRPSRWRWLAVAAAVAVLGGVGGYVAVMRGDRGEPGAASAAPPRDAGAVAVVPSRPIVTPIAALPIDAGVAPAPPRPAITAPARPPRRIVRPPAAGSAAPPPAIAIVTNPAYTHIGAANVRKDAGDGRGCLAELDAAEREGTMDAASGVEVKFLRATCLMLAGQCEAGRKLSAEYWNGKNLGDSTAARDVDAMVAENCRGGARSDRDRLVRAVFVLGDLAHRHSAGECRAAYDDARALAKTAPPAENGDTLFDLAERIHNTAPGCFARAGDCVSAWTVAKEVDETFSNHVSTDVTKRGTFHWSVGVKCIDKDQGALSDAEVFERAHSELREIREVPTRTAAFCGARIATALAVLPRLPANTGYRLLDAAATCLGYTKDCTGAWQQYSQVGQAIGLDDRRVRSEFTQHFSRLMGCAPP